MTVLWVLICTGIAVGLLWTIQEALKLPEDASSSNGVNEETQRAEPRF
jgi:hypothetical protein